MTTPDRPDFSSPRENALVTYDRALDHVDPAWGDNVFTALHQLTQDIKEA